jgi:hypothetical protein
LFWQKGFLHSNQDCLGLLCTNAYIGLAKDSVKIAKFQSMGRCPDGRNVSFGNQFFFRIGRLAGNVWLVAGGQIKTFALSHVIKINKELQTSMTHSPARLQ